MNRAGELSDHDHEMVRSFTADTFAEFIGQQFIAGNDDNDKVELTLVEVNRHDELRERERQFDHRPRAPFSLLFLTSLSAPLQNGIKQFRHEALGEFPLSVQVIQMPVGLPPIDPPATFCYESVFA